MDFNSISKSLQDAIVNVTKDYAAGEQQNQHSLVEENNIVGVIDGVRSDRKYNDADHAHYSLGKLVAYQKAKKAELYVNGEKTKHYELNKRYDDFEPKKLSEESIEQIDEISKELAGKYLTAPQGKGANKYKVSMDKAVYPNYDAMSKHDKSVGRALKRSGGSALNKKPSYYKEETEQLDELSKGTLASYTRKAVSRMNTSSSVKPRHLTPAGNIKKGSDEKVKKLNRQINNRLTGINKAVSRLAKEDGDQVEEAAVHPMGLHVKPVKIGGKTKYKVHAVGSELGGGIKVGEHLTDTHLDDATEMGAKIKHLKENQMVDKTIELHDDFIIDLPSELGFQDYLDAAKGFSEDPSEAILIADSFFKSRDESLVIENFLRSDIDSKIKAHEKAGHKVDDTKYSTKNGKPYAEYTVTDSEGRKSRYIHHGSTRRVER